MVKPMLSYEELCSWRDICEFLNQQWYRFGDPDDLASGCPKAQSILWLKEGQEQRELLWDSWMIQFITWGKHPILNFKNKREFKKVRGWTLIRGWESKLYFLEQIVLLDRDPQTTPKPWQPALIAKLEERQRLRMEELERRVLGHAIWDLQCKKMTEGAITLFNERCQRKATDGRSAVPPPSHQGLCGWCAAPQIALMMDCPGCGRGYEV